MLNLPYLEVPLITGSDGAVRVCGTQVTLDEIVERYEDGTSPEDIVAHHDRLRLSDVYLVISLYLKRRKEVEEYLAARQASQSGHEVKPQPAA